MCDSNDIVKRSLWRQSRAGSHRTGLPPDNGELAELLSLEAGDAPHLVQRALRRAARSAFLWPEEARDLFAQGRSPSELAHVGPFLEKKIREWIEGNVHPPPGPDIRAQFLTTTKARALLATERGWMNQLRGDLHMHTQWSDGSGTVREMAEAARKRGYEYIAITDHTKGLRVANGINEESLARQGREIVALNKELATASDSLTVLRSTEMNLSTSGAGGMEASTLTELDLVLASFHSALRRETDQTERYLLPPCATRTFTFWGIPRGRIYNHRSGLHADWPRVFDQAARLNKAVEYLTGYPDRQDLNVDILKLARQSSLRADFTRHRLPSSVAARVYRTRTHRGLVGENPRGSDRQLPPLRELKMWAESVRGLITRGDHPSDSCDISLYAS